ncbi:hypothetical protein AHMF7605_01750 [Adhaeribacter arboris]|uniref:Baseplate protein J-like domain-containing protein n=1 Tax=Adhaeribacter arboris TaxID=2072846 RepID=A0A2T2Y9Z8_9BACT|nr:hypothetical protein [Adhaeribacter arboris]PSR52334.1 hypothetical protein AHMF7605_01750 [Adhaeribacter arboris]
MNKDLRSIGNILKQEGTSRYERYLPALDPQSVLIDDRKLQDFISYAQRYAKQVWYVHANGENDNLTESWEYFFKNDIVLLLANIATKNVKYYKETYDQLQEFFNQEPLLANFIDLLEFTFARFKKINSWYYASALDSTLNFDLKLYIGSYLRRELESLQEMILYARNLTGKNYRLADFKVDFFSTHNQPNANEREINEILQKYGLSGRTFTSPALLEKVNEIINQDNVWDVTDRENIRARERLFAGTNDEEKLRSAALRLNKIFDAIYHATENIVNNSQSYFEEAIHQKQDHLPHMALFISFIKLFGYARQELNKLPQKHLDFYYKDVLRIKTKLAVPDKTYVVLELAKGFEFSPVKKGTALLAGKDKYNNELHYETDEDILVNKAQIAAVETIFIQQNADKQTLNYYTESITSDANATEEVAPSWKMFGEPKVANTAEIGFGMASTQFYLSKGERNVVVTFTSEEPIAYEQFNTRLLRLLLTGEKGWLNSDDPKSGIFINSLTRTSPTTLELNFSVALTQKSAIVAFDPTLHAGNFNTTLPVAQYVLKYPRRQLLPEDPQYSNFQDSVQQLNTLQNLKITQSTIRVQVGSLNASFSLDGVKDLVLENTEATLDSKKPFYPFTAIPKVGSAFYIGCKDLYHKNIDKLTVNLEWLLPDNFRAYYNKYLPPYDSNKFKAAFSVLKNKRWQKINDVSVIDKDSIDPKYRTIRLDFSKLKQVTEADSADSEISIDNERQDGTLMLKLNYPDFGHGIYPQLITTAMMEKAASKYGSVDFYKIVKKQLHDSVISIKLPDDINQRQGSLRVVVYDILEKVKNNDQARTMMTNGLSELIRRINGSNVITRKPPPTTAEAEETAPADQDRVLVNDENYIERILRFLKKVRLIDKEIHYDQDMQDTDQVVDRVKDKVNTSADFILPSDQELVGVIMNEANNAINKTVANVVDEILTFRETNRLPDPETVAALLTQEFNEANEVINDMIARKIAILLSANEIPPPPYAPVVNAISLSYTASKSSAEGDEFFHITPLGVFPIKVAGYSNQGALPTGKLLKTASIFPQSILDNPNRPDIMPGMLFIGVRDLVPPQNLSVLVQVAEGSRLNDKKPPKVHWWYLHNYEWLQLKDEAIISDSTYGLQTTGLLQFSIPSAANNVGNLFAANGLFWLCASVARDPDAFPRLVSLKAQVVRVTFKDQDNDPRHLALPLEANKIKSLVDQNPQIKKVSQPVASFLGQVQENSSTYYVRVSERLRHKGRAITNWDYERLVLQNFSAVFKVKCLNNYHNGQFVTGHVTVVPVSDLRNKNYYGSNVLIPKTSYIDLRKIEELLSACSSPFVKVHAQNPQLDQILIRCKVKFYTGVDQGYYLQRLNEDLIQFLTPWASGNANALSFSAKIYASSIINFIDQRDYVDYVVDLIMQQYTETESGEKIFAVNPDQLTSLVETKFTTGHSILVSAPKHEIELM